MPVLTRLLVMALTLSIASTANAGFAAESAEPDRVLTLGPAVDAPDEGWVPPARAPEEPDWLLLKTGEWVRGRLDRVSDGTAYFDSEEFEDVEIDWVDIAELRSAHMHTYRFQRAGAPDDEIVRGTAGMVDGVFRLDTGEGVLEFQQADLVSMISGGLKESDYWSYEATLGVTTRSGNTDQTDLSAFAKIQRETALTRGWVSYRGSYSTVNGGTTANSHRGQLQLDSYVTRRLFIVIPTAEVFHDTFQNIALRTTVGAGVGYDLIKWPKLSWEVGTGVNYQYTDFDSAPLGDASTSNDAAVALSTTIELDPLPNLEWDTSYKVQIVVTDLDLTNHNLTSVVSLDIWGPLDLDVTAVWDRIEKPRLQADGTRPKSNDLRTTVGLSLDF